LLSDSEYRLHFLLHLNNARAAGKFCISKNTFIQLGQIMYRIVDFISTEKDFESMRYLLIMCQTYFFLNKQGEKFYLVRYIENHKLFQSNEFWEFYFSDSIFQEIEKQNKGALELKKLGYNVFIRNITDDMFKMKNINTYFVDSEGYIYVIYAYGNNNLTTEMDIVVF
jgi:hypothetical protein